MARLTAWAGALLVLACASLNMRVDAQAGGPYSYDTEPDYDLPVMVDRGFRVSKSPWQPGGTYRIYGRVTLQKFGNPSRIYCAMQNRNQTQGAQVAWGTPEAYSSPKTKVKKHIWETYYAPRLEAGKAIFEFFLPAASSVQGKTWTFYMRGVKLDPTTTLPSITWRWYCEAYWDKKNASAVPPYWKKIYPIGELDASRFTTVPIAGPRKPNPNRRAKPPAGSNK